MQTTSNIGDVLAPSRDVSMTPRGERHEGGRRLVLSAKALSGARVRNSAGEDLGKIEEIMLDVHTGHVAYAVLSFGGFLGMGDKLFALPWQALSLDEEAREFILNVDKHTLETAPGFDKDNWPDMADADWDARLRHHYGMGSTGPDEVDNTFDRDLNRSLKG